MSILFTLLLFNHWLILIKKLIISTKLIIPLDSRHQTPNKWNETIPMLFSRVRIHSTVFIFVTVSITSLYNYMNCVNNMWRVNTLVLDCIDNWDIVTLCFITPIKEVCLNWQNFIGYRYRYNGGLKNGNFVVKIYRCFTVKTVKISKATW